MEYIKKPLEKIAAQSENVQNQVAQIIETIRQTGDKGLNEYNQKFDQLTRETPWVQQTEIDEAYKNVAPDLIESMKVAAERIKVFAELQRGAIQEVAETEVIPGLFLGSKLIPIESVLCYVPGGNAPLFSTAMMLAIPAKTADVKNITACAPPMKGTQQIHPATLVALDLCGVTQIAVMGGAQAVAAFAYGTESIEPVDLIVGPGNQYVTEAKRQVYGQVGIDFVAGPSEVLIIADETAHPEVVAADLLAQAEHDTNAVATLITTSKQLAKNVNQAVTNQLSGLPTKSIAEVSWRDNGAIIVVTTLEEATILSNQLAPEHLEVITNPNFDTESLINYGSLFIGPYTAEVFGDYTSGTNHTLPTSRAARYTGGVSVGAFLKTVTYQRIEREGFETLKEATKMLAENEGLEAHRRAITKRETFLKA